MLTISILKAKVLWQGSFIILVVLASLSACGPQSQSQKSETPTPTHVLIEKPKAPVTVTINSKPVYVDPDVSADWKVDAAIEIWNEALGCEYLYLVDKMTTRAVFIDTYEENDNSLGFQQGPIIMLNTFDYPEPYIDGPNLGTTVHEIGHVLGLEHTSEPWDVMYGVEDDVPVPYESFPTQLTENDLRQLEDTGYDYC